MLARDLAVGATFLLLIAGCSGSDDGGLTGSGANGSGANGSGADGSGDAAGTDGSGLAGASATGTGATGSGTGATGTGASGSFVDENQDGIPDNECAAVWTDTEAVPAILHFVIDKSTSMNESAPSTGSMSKWEATRAALVDAFPNMPSSLAVGEFFYPNADGGCVQPETGGVPIAPLTAPQVQALQDGVMAIANPTNPAGTPTHDAWREGLRELMLTLNDPPAGFESARGYLVLVTDGMPVRTLNCGRADGNNIAVTEAQFDEFIDDVAATSQNTGIQTFVIGVPGSENDNQVPTVNGVPEYQPRTKLSEVAIAGQTATAGCSTTGPNYCHIDMTDPSIDFVAELTRVVGDISVSVASCEYPVPVNTNPMLIVDPFVPLLVNYFPGGSSTPESLPQSVGCDTGVGWDYTDASESSITLCPTTCNTIREDPAAEIRVSLGCIEVG